MKYIFCSLMFTDIDENIRRSKEPNAISGHKFQLSIIRGLLDNSCDLYVLNVPRIRHYPDYPEKKIRSQAFILDGKQIGESIGFNNRFLVSYWSQYIQIKKQLFEVLKAQNGEECVLITFNSYLQQLLSMLNIRKKFPNVKICDIIGDLHGEYGLLRENYTTKEKLVDLYGRLEDHLAKKCDYYVFLSAYMNEFFCCDASRFVVIEGIYSGKETKNMNCDEEMDDLKRLLYAGSLDVEYDIEHLLRAFQLTNNSEYRLLIAGNGNGVDLVKKAKMTDHRIEYLGVLSPNELNGYIHRATALISPRKNNHTYVKYSFPSKTLECLASGKPYIAHKLISEPEEYADYILYADETDEALGRKISEVLNLPRSEQVLIGEKAKKFILQEKTPRRMCMKIIDMCERKRK